MAAYAAVHEPDQPQLAYKRCFHAAYNEGSHSDFSPVIAKERSEREQALAEYNAELMARYGQPVAFPQLSNHDGIFIKNPKDHDGNGQN